MRAGICHWGDDGQLVGYRDETGAQYDRKCLRMSYCTWLKLAGVDLRDAMHLMRHTDPKLTARIYTDLRLDDLSGAQSKITALDAKRSKSQS